jgi:hypothetical protein
MPIEYLCLRQQLFQLLQKFWVIALKRFGTNHNNKIPSIFQPRKQLPKRCPELPLNAVPNHSMLADFLTD